MCSHYSNHTRYTNDPPRRERIAGTSPIACILYITCIADFAFGLREPVECGRIIDCVNRQSHPLTAAWFVWSVLFKATRICSLRSLVTCLSLSLLHTSDPKLRPRPDGSAKKMGLGPVLPRVSYYATKGRSQPGRSI